MPGIGIRLFVVLSTCLWLSACGGGGEDDDDQTTPPAGGGGGGTTPPPTASNNLSATGLQVLTQEPRIAYPLSVSVSINAIEATSDVSVSLFAIQENDDPDVAVRQFPLGSFPVENLRAGNGAYEFDTNIPSTVEESGSYLIAAVVDPVNVFSETDEDDNLITIETTLSARGNPNVMLNELVLDRAAMEIDTSSYADQVPGTEGNVHNADAAATMNVGADGLGVNESMELEAYARLRMSRSDLGTTHDVPLYLWNSEQERYMNAYGVDPDGATLGAEEWLPVGQFNPQLVSTIGDEAALDDLDRDSVLIDFYFPGKLGQELETATRYANRPVTFGDAAPTIPPPDLTVTAISGLRAFLRNLPTNGIDGDESEAMAVMDFEICVEIRPTDSLIVDERSDDNEKCSPLMVMLPPIPPPPVPDGAPPGFIPMFKNPSEPLKSSQGFKIKGGGSAFGFAVDFPLTATADNRGYIEELSGGVPITVFGTSIDFVSLSLRLQLVPDYAGKPVDEESGYTFELRHVGQVLHAVSVGATSPPAVSVSFSKEKPDPEKPYQAWVGPVPVTGGATVAANLGVEYEFTFTGNEEDGFALGNSISPFVNGEATIYAGVGTALFSAGVEGVLNLLEERITLFGGSRIELLDDGFDSGIAEFIVVQGVTLTNEITGPRGAINLFAKYSVPAFRECSWGLFTGLCPTIKTIKATKNIWKSKALFYKEDILLDIRGAQLDVVVVPGQPPAYYVP